MSPAPASPDRHRGWTVAFVAAAFLVAARNLIGLDHAPPGLYNDEASIGYNAWAIAHSGRDEHGVATPLYFTAFGEYKNPVYIYVLSGLLRFLPLTPAVTRLPAAIFGLITIACLTDTVWRMTRSRPVALATLVLGAVTPWLTLESRVAFEVISMVAGLAVALWCLARGLEGRAIWFLGAGAALGLSVFAYTTARVEVALLAAAALPALLLPWHRRPRGWWLAIPPLGCAYAILLWWNAAHPGALTSRFDLVSIFHDHPTASVAAGRFLRNYIAHLDPYFLLARGDANLRHNTGHSGMLLATSAPLLAVGLAVCLRSIRDHMSRILLLGVVLGPVSVALTSEAIPHALRAANLIPFLILIMAVGVREITRIPRPHRNVLAMAFATALVVEATGYTVDLYSTYPARSQEAWDAGIAPAISAAAEGNDNHPILISRNLDSPIIQALFVIHPLPPEQVDNTFDSAPLAASIGVTEVDPTSLGSAESGSLLILGPNDSPPASATLIDTEFGLSDDQPVPPVLATVYRLP